LKVLGDVEVGALPRGLVFAADGGLVYVAAAGSDEVVQLHWDTRKVTQRWPAPREPRDLALSADGSWLAAASTRSAQVRCWNTETGKLYWERTITDAFNLRGLSFTPDAKELICGHAYRREFPVSKNNIDSGWVIDNRLSKLSLAPNAQPEYWQLALDIRGQAVGDPHGLAFSSDGKQLVAAASGTHELLILQRGNMPWSPGEPGDFIDVAMEIGPNKMRRVDLGGRPMTVAFADNDRTVAVANYLRDAVQIVDVQDAKLVRTISLGGPKQPSLARQGEAMFYDAQRSHHQWFSCHTCHTDGHTCGLKFDTLNDDSYGNPKLTPSLYNVTKTGPWTWHGWQKDLGAAIEKSLMETMFGDKPKPEDIKAMLAFLETLTPPPNPHRGPNGALNAAAERGKAIFHGKARCARCHKGELYTSESNYDVKLEDDGSPYPLWNPPSLIGLWDRGPYLHDARSTTLDGLLRFDHSSEKLGGEKLTEAERRELVEFLKSL
jgi:cytochrome c peroxidase